MINTETKCRGTALVGIPETLLFDIHSEQKKEDENQKLGHVGLFSKKIWKIKDVAEFLECSIGHVYNLSSRDLIPKKKKGKCLFFDPKEILEWIYQGD